MTNNNLTAQQAAAGFQYRKRYEITCDLHGADLSGANLSEFQYRKRYEITCDRITGSAVSSSCASFNTASGMRSHVTQRKRDWGK